MSTYTDMESVFPEEHNTLQVAKCADCADRLVTKRVLAERQRISEVLVEWRANYPEDVFPATSNTNEAAAARMAEHVLTEILAIVNDSSVEDTP